MFGGTHPNLFHMLSSVLQAPWLPWKFNFKQLAYLDCEIALPCLNSLKIKASSLTQQLSFSGLEPNDNLNILSTLRGTLLVGVVAYSPNRQTAAFMSQL